MRALGLVGLHGLVLGFGIAVYSFARDPPPMSRVLERYALLADSFQTAKGEAREGVRRELRGLQSRMGFYTEKFFYETAVERYQKWSMYGFLLGVGVMAVSFIPLYFWRVDSHSPGCLDGQKKPELIVVRGRVGGGF